MSKRERKSQFLNSLGKNKRFWLSLALSFLCAVLLCCAFSTSFSAAAVEERSVPACPCHGGSATALTAGGMISSSGNYYLADNLELDSEIIINGVKVNICLNGHTLSKKANGNVITVIGDNAELNLFDCGSTVGVITHSAGFTGTAVNSGDFTATFNMYGGSIAGNVSASSYPAGVKINNFNMYSGSITGNTGSEGAGGVEANNFNLYGGKISGNTGKIAGGVYVGSGYTFNMSGGEIAGNKCTGVISDYSGGIYCNNPSSVTFSGSAKVYDNAKGDNLSNVQTNGCTIDVGVLNDDAYIGVTGADTQNFDDGSFIGSNGSGKSIDDLLKKHFFNDKASHIHKIGDLIAEVAATCKDKGVKKHYECTVEGCDAVFDASKVKVNKEDLEIPITNEHDYGTLIETKSATCIDTGLQEHYQCSVCDKYFDSDKAETTYENLVIAIDSDNHTNTETIPAVEATCAAEGKTEGTRCNDCNTVIVAQTTVPKSTEHTLTHTDRVAATCIATGREEYYHCSVCDKYFDSDKAETTYESLEIAIDGANHTNTEAIPAVEATCAAEGKTEGTRCKDCDTVVVAQTAIPKTAHTLTHHESVEATCAAEGANEYWECTGACGKNYVDEACTAEITQITIPAKPHTPEKTEGKAATCTEEGLTDGEKCSVCGAVTVAQTAIPKIPHTEVIVPETPATCTDDGLTEGKYCSVCESVIAAQVTIPAKGHSPEVDPEKRATCTEDGLTAGSHCSVCGLILQAQEVVERLGHNYQAGTVTPPKENEVGYTTYICANCGDTRKDDFVPAAGHDYQAGKVTEPTCLEQGYTTYICKECGDSYKSDFVPELGHDYLLTVTDATCTENGYTTRTCSRCGESDKTNYTPALGHDYTDTVVAPTCTEGGYTVKTCSRCGESIKTNFTLALGHDYVDTVVAPTCTEGGYTSRTCSHCGDNIITDYTDALGHDFSGDCATWVWADDCFTATVTLSCSRGDSYTEEVATGIDEESTTATCTQSGETVFVATVTVNGVTYTDTKAVSGTTVPHKYELVKWEWNGFETASATYECSVCGDSGTSSGEVASERVEPTCVNDGLITYTVTVNYPYLQTATDTKTEVIAATGHNFEVDSWSWGEDYSATAGLTCKTCGEHSSQNVEVTFVDDGENRTYTATVEINGEVYTDTKTVPLGDVPGGNEPSGGGSDNFFRRKWWLILVIAGAVLLLIVIIVIIVKRRRADDEDDDDEDDEDDDYDGYDDYDDEEDEENEEDYKDEEDGEEDENVDDDDYNEEEDDEDEEE